MRNPFLDDVQTVGRNPFLDDAPAVNRVPTMTVRPDGSMEPTQPPPVTTDLPPLPAAMQASVDPSSKAFPDSLRGMQDWNKPARTPSNLTIYPKSWEPYDSPGVSEHEKNVPSPPPSQLADLAKSFLAGVERAGIGLAGLPGDVGDIMRGLAGVEGPRMTGLIPTSEQVKGAVEGATGPIYEPQTTAGEYARTVGEFVPGAAFPGGPLARAASVVVPGLASEAAGQATEGTAAEPYARIAGAVAGGMAPSALSRAVTPFPISAERRAALQTLRAEGVTPTAGQAAGSKGLQYAESEIGGGATARAMDRQSDEFTGAVLRRAGESATRATPEVIDRAFNRIGGEFDRLARSNNITPVAYPRLMQSLRAVNDEYTDLVPAAGQAKIISKTLGDIASRIQQGQPIPGNAYQSFRSRFDRLARGAKNDPQLSDALYGIRNALDDAMEDSLVASGRQTEIAAWQEARRQYKNLLVIERAASGGGAESGLGAISPAQLRQADKAQNLRSHARGKSEFSKLAKAGQAVLTPMPQSGTAPRSWARNIPAMMAGGAVGGMTAGTIGATLGAAAGPFIAGRALMSRPVQSYLRNQLMPGRTNNALARTGVNALLARPKPN